MTFHYIYNYPQVARDGGFKLRNYKDGPLDWRLIGSIEIERIVRDESFEQIDAVLNHLSEAPLGSILDSHILDSGIAKYFMLSQFSVQYLLFCRKFLEESVTDLRESHSNSQMELATTKRLLSEARNEILQLHKKLTQMEAIHEVLYPCHLCTKNFVNNDSLNLHISRKHNTNLIKPEKKKTDISQPVCKERENDLTLINTIKLELEIKRLKERLNNAEREIKEKNIEADMKNSLEKSERITAHSIGIQSNLSEVKERDDSGHENEINCNPFQNQQEMSKLQEKLQEFEKWKEEQILENSEFLNKVNSKMQEISASLEITRNQIEIQIDDEKQKPLSAAEDLEKILTKKVEEIGESTAAKLEDIVKKIEMSYKEKLQIFEKELNKLNEQYILQKDRNTESSKTIKVHSGTAIHIEENEINQNRQDKVNESKNQLNKNHKFEESSESESNHTFVKHTFVTVNHLEKNSSNDEESLSTSVISDEECTNLSTGLPDEQRLTKACIEEESINKPMKRYKTRLPQEHKFKPKIVTKRNAERITNKRLSSLGVDTNTKTLTSFLKKKYLEVNEKRNKSKQAKSQFYATRSKIKKLVDKLCSTKMPSNAEALLKATEHIKAKNSIYLSDDEYSLTEEEDASIISNECNLPENKNFKQRLEHILASPIRKPDDHLIEDIVKKELENKKPIPMPRKRVMFNQPEAQKKFFNYM